MPPTLTPQEFVNKWRKSTLKERAAAQEHFIDLCRLVGHQAPAEAGSAGKFFTFEAGAINCFETFPLPWPPGRESANDPRIEAIAQAARQLVEKRDVWLNPPGLSEAELKKRTLTNLSSQRRPGSIWRTGSWMRRSSMPTAGRAISAMRKYGSGCWR